MHQRCTKTAAAFIALAVFSGNVRSGEIKDQPDRARAFDIPAQSLEDALYAFDAATGIEIFVDGRMTSELKSSAVKGVLTSSQALRVLLEGTNLRAKRIGAGAITLSVEDAPKPANSLFYRNYSAVIQNSVLHALCENSETRPGTYRIAMRLRLNPLGVISDVDLLSSTGDLGRDARLHKIIAGLSTGAAPPPPLPQPVIMVILPHPPQGNHDCT